MGSASISALLFVSNLLASGAKAAPLPNKVRPSSALSAASAPKLGEFFNSGSVTGGQAVAGTKSAFSILRVQKLANAAGVERLILTFGDQDGLPLSVPPGFFHLALDQSGTRLVLDLAQTLKTTVDHHDLARVFKDSKYVKTAEMTMDPLDSSTNIILQMKKPVQARANTEKDEKKINQLVIDFEEAPL